MRQVRIGASATAAVFLVLALGLAGRPAIALRSGAPQLATRLVIEPNRSELDYEVHAKLFLVADEDIIGRNRDVSGEALVRGNAVSGQIRLKVAGFKSGVGTRDLHVAQILQVDEFPEIVFALNRVDGFDPLAPEGRCTVGGTLTVRDYHVPLAIPLRYTHSGDQLQLDGVVPTRFSNFSIAPPVLGFIVKRAPDALLLGAHLVAQVQEAPIAAGQPHN